MATATKTETVTFNSMSHNYRAIRRATRQTRDVHGVIQTFDQAREIRELEQRNLDREQEGLDPLPIDRSPWEVEFEHNEFTTDDPVLIEFLRNHEDFNLPQGFYEQGAAPDEPKPTIKEQNARIIKATVAKDVAELEAIRAGELETHNRRPILDAVDNAISEIEAPESGAEEEPSTSASSPTD
jgi:hypothetical protein